MPDRAREAMNRALHALSLMRRGRGLGAAAHEAGTTSQTVLRLAGSAVRRTATGWKAHPTDSFQRRLLFLFQDGTDFITVGGSRRASAISDYWRAIGRYLEQGQDRELQRFAGRHIVDAHGKHHPFITDRTILRRLARAGQVSGFNSIY